MYRIAAVAVAMLLLAGCSRKPDENPPTRIGDLQVLFKVDNQAGLPENIPVIVSLYTDTSHTVLARADTVTTKNDRAETVEFTNLAATFFYLQLRINLPAFQVPTCEDITVFVKQDQMSTTKLVVMHVRENLTQCEEL